MCFDKLSLFADGLTVATTANGTTYGKVIDLRKCGEVGIDGMLRVWAYIIGTANTSGTITTKLQTFDGYGESATLVSQTQVDGELMALILPCKGLKRFLRLDFCVGSTALDSAVKVKAGLVDQFNIDELPDLSHLAGAGTDLAVLGDKVNTAIDVSTNSLSGVAGDTFSVDISAGVVQCVSAPTGFTVTCDGEALTIAVASATTGSGGNVVVTGTTGATETIAVTLT